MIPHGLDAPDHTVTRLLHELRAGRTDAFDELLPVVLDTLRRIAHRQLRHERPDHTLNTTALVNEAYLKLVGNDLKALENRSHFFAVASRAMRQVLISYARARNAEKRGGGAIHITLDENLAPLAETQVEELIALNGALERLERINSRHVRIVECRFFAGLTVAETAEALGVASLALYGQRRARTEGRAQALMLVGSNRYFLADYAAADSLHREAHALNRALLGPDHPETITGLRDLGFVAYARGDAEAALRYAHATLDGYRRAYGDVHPHVANAINDVGFLHRRRGNYAEAERYYREGLAMSRQLLGDAHPEVAVKLNNLGALLYAGAATTKRRRSSGRRSPSGASASTPTTRVPSARSATSPRSHGNRATTTRRGPTCKRRWRWRAVSTARPTPGSRSCCTARARSSSPAATPAAPSAPSARRSRWRGSSGRTDTASSRCGKTASQAPSSPRRAMRRPRRSSARPSPRSSKTRRASPPNWPPSSSASAASWPRWGATKRGGGC